MTGLGRGGRLEEPGGRANHAFERGLPDAAVVYATGLLEELIRDLAARSGIRERGRSATTLARELVFRGVIPEGVAGTLGGALARRSRPVHGHRGVAAPTRKELDAGVEACRSLQEPSRLEAVE